MKTQIKGLVNGYDPKMFAFPRDQREGSSVLERERVWKRYLQRTECDCI